MSEEKAEQYVTPAFNPDRTFTEKVKALPSTVAHKFFTRDGLIGEYDYMYLFTPDIPFLSRERKVSPFFGLNDSMPVFLAMILGFQHALAMLAGIMTPAIILSSAINLDTDLQQYLVSASFITCGILSTIQISRFHIPKTGYYIGTGLLSVVGTSFATIPVAQGAFSQMYAQGICPTAADGTPQACPQAFGYLIASSCVCGLFEVLLSFIPPKVLQRMFPPIVTGPTVLLIGVHLVETGFKNWAGGSNACASRPESGFFSLCPNINAPKPLPWGSAEFVGLGFSVYVTIILCERFGAPIMKSCAVIVGLLVGCIIAAACGYFDDTGIKQAPAATFIWVHTFPLKVYGPLILPFLAVYLVLMMEAIGDITATCDVSRLPVEGREYESRIQGGILADGLNGILAGLMTLTPMSVFAQNNGVISLTKCANRSAGFFCCFFLLIMGIFSKFAAALVSIPSAVLGGMTTFLFTAVAVSGLRIISTVPFNRRNRFVLTCSLAIGFGATLVPDWFSYVFTYSGDNHSLQGFLNAIVLVLESGFAITAIIGLILNLIIPMEVDEANADEVAAGESTKEAESSSQSEEDKKA
ncbi:hypothetical protein CANCADRAFT_56224 [Tortispora caseinolytica NRRL Y-17796]|uniref:Purine permease n=1 Tax=Tortispora caseinolytica NRRL Y-17796 TaxID=767744 RepID=A0A1E4TLG4_9ASCO|nr:hypothetical protein CANCADRAFT_56224 [Tortispora caseinolytica NRRL Y-17796]